MDGFGVGAGRKQSRKAKVVCGVTSLEHDLCVAGQGIISVLQKSLGYGCLSQQRLASMRVTHVMGVQENATVHALLTAAFRDP